MTIIAMLLEKIFNTVDISTLMNYNIFTEKNKYKYYCVDEISTKPGQLFKGVSHESKKRQSFIAENAQYYQKNFCGDAVRKKGTGKNFRQ